MDDEDLLREIDERLRAVLTPDAAAQRRIAARALRNTARPGARRPSILTAAAALVLLVGLATWLARRPRHPPSPTTLSISSSGALLIVDGDDGRRWVVGRPAESAPQGRYVIVVSP